MRKREIEKLLEKAVAEALGVELKSARGRESRASAAAAAKPAYADHRAAA